MPPPKKRLGQRFLTDRNILAAIADAINVGPSDAVIEVGPGRGALTAVLAARARDVVAVELDAELARSFAAEAPPNVRIVEGDARAADPAALLGGCRPYKLLGNLPYYAAMPIIRAFLESSCRPSAASLLVQREVAEQLCAAPGAMSLASLAVQMFGHPRIVRIVRPGSFNPPPKVTSAVVAIDIYNRPAENIDSPARFFALARAGFSAPRKQLRNALAAGLAVSPVDAAALLASAGVDPARRAETLSIPEWAALYRAWSRPRTPEKATPAPPSPQPR